MKFKIKRSLSAAQPYHFVIEASNGQILATSENYVTKASAEHAVNLIKAGAAAAPVAALV